MLSGAVRSDALEVHLRPATRAEANLAPGCRSCSVRTL